MFCNEDSHSNEEVITRPLTENCLCQVDMFKKVKTVMLQGALYNDLQGVAYLLLDKTGIGFSSVEVISLAHH